MITFTFFFFADEETGFRWLVTLLSGRIRFQSDLYIYAVVASYSHCLKKKLVSWIKVVYYPILSNTIPKFGEVIIVIMYLVEDWLFCESKLRCFSITWGFLTNAHLDRG